MKVQNRKSAIEKGNTKSGFSEEMVFRTGEVQICRLLDIKRLLHKGCGSLLHRRLMVRFLEKIIVWIGSVLEYAEQKLFKWAIVQDINNAHFLFVNKNILIK